MIEADRPLTSPEAWAGLWIRSRSGPRDRGHPPLVETSTWHRVRDIGGWHGRIRTTCGYGPRDGFMWPAGGYRLEVARLDQYGTLPGAICPRCKAWPESANPVRPSAEDEVHVDDIDAIADAVAARLAERQGDAS